MAQKKVVELPLERRRSFVDQTNDEITIGRQCELLGVSRSGYYYEPIPESEDNLKLMELIDKIYMDLPFYGRRRICEVLRKDYHLKVNPKRVRRLMQVMRLEAIYPKPDLSKSNQKHKKYKYLLKNVTVDRVDQVWSADITYIPMKGGYVYLVAVMDWFSRKVLGWKLSNSLDGSFCNELLAECLDNNQPEIFNTDQGVQFTAEGFVGQLLEKGVQVSMDGKGRALDNVFIERVWRSLKYENIYIHRYEEVKELLKGLDRYFKFYNQKRRHQSLENRVPDEVYRSG